MCGSRRVLRSDRPFCYPTIRHVVMHAAARRVAQLAQEHKVNYSVTQVGVSNLWRAKCRFTNVSTKRKAPLDTSCAGAGDAGESAAMDMVLEYMEAALKPSGRGRKRKASDSAHDGTNEGTVSPERTPPPPPPSPRPPRSPPRYWRTGYGTRRGWPRSSTRSPGLRFRTTDFRPAGRWGCESRDCWGVAGPRRAPLLARG